MEVDIVSSLSRAGLYLGLPFLLVVFVMQWKWANTCDNYIQVLVVGQGGGGSFKLAPKAGGEVSIQNPQTNTIRTWPINELSTIDVLYPGVGWMPKFLQKTIRMAIVHEGDWEPLLNRSPHMQKVMSPDMVVALTKIAEIGGSTTKKMITELLSSVATSPTREMIASPAVLGNLLHEKISEVLATVAKDVFDPLKKIMENIGKPVNPNIVYLGLAVIVIGVVYLVFQIKEVAEMDVAKMADDIARIKQSLGVK